MCAAGRHDRRRIVFAEGRMPNFSGVWNAAVDRSVFRMAPPRSLRMWITHEGEAISHRVLTVWPDGSERLAELQYAIGGRVEAQIADRLAVIGAFWRDDILVIESELSDPPMQLRDHWSMSADGRTLTMAHYDDVLAGQTCVLERESDTV
jgi:hypothetical protein